MVEVLEDRVFSSTTVDRAEVLIVNVYIVLLGASKVKTLSDLMALVGLEDQ